MPGKGNTVSTALKVQIVDFGFGMFLLPAAGLRNSCNSTIRKWNPFPWLVKNRHYTHHGVALGT
jgi:hypothetical protein